MASSRITSVVIAMFLVGLIPSDARANKWFAWLEELSGPGPFRGNTLRFDVYCNGRLDHRILNAYVALLQTPAAASPQEQIEKTRLAFVRSGWCRPDRANVRFSLGVEAGWWTARENTAFVGDVDLRTLYVILYSPVGTIVRPGRHDRTGPAPDFEPPSGVDTSPLRAIELGAGFGGYRMSGSAVQTSDHRGWVVPLRVRVFPSELLLPVDPGSRAVPKWRRALRAVSLYGGIDYLPGRLPSSAFRTAGPTEDTLSERERVPTWGVNIDLFAFLPGGALVR